MDVRGRRLRKRSDEVTAFTSSLASDAEIAVDVIRVNQAHMVSLVRGKEVSRQVGVSILRFLDAAEFKPGKPEDAEDYHQLLEQRAVDALGVETAGYMNLGKSRNDQVSTAIRMELRRKLLLLLNGCVELEASLLGVVRRYGRTVMPGYTHLQRAQPVSVAHHCFAVFDAIQRDTDRLLQLHTRVNLSPMGAAALGGTAVGVDRTLVARLLGFDGIIPNAMDAVSARDVVLEAISVVSILMVDLSRFCEELILWSSREFGFVELADEYSASSSIMPQKKNPVVAEISRAKTGSVLGSLVAVSSIMKALPHAYNLDLQETTPHLWRALDDAIGSVRMTAGMAATLKFNLHAINDSLKEDYSTATALADYLSSEKGLSFREAHAIVGELVTISLKEGISLESAAASHISRVSGRYGKKVMIRPATAARVLDPAHFLASISTEGGANRKFIPAELERRASALSRTRISIGWLEGSLGASDERLRKAVSELTGEVKIK